MYLGTRGELPEKNKHEQDHQRLMNLVGIFIGKFVCKCQLSQNPSHAFLCKKGDIILLQKIFSLGSFHLKDRTWGYKT